MSQRGADHRRDGRRQPLLVRVVVPALAVAAQVVAHDRGHLHPVQRAEPVHRGRRRRRPGRRRAVRPQPGSPVPRAPRRGKVAVVGEEQEPAEVDPRVADAPDLPVDDGGRPRAHAQHVAEAEVAVQQRRRDDRPVRVGQPAQQLLRARAQLVRYRVHGSTPPLQLAGRAPRLRRARSSCATGRPGAAGAARGPRRACGRGPDRRAARARRAPARPPPRRRTPWRTRRAVSSTAATAGTGTAEPASARSTWAWRSMSLRPTGRSAGGTALTSTRGPRRDRVRQAGVAAGQHLQRHRRLRREAAATGRRPACDRLRTSRVASVIGPLLWQAEHPLGDDVALDLVGAAGDAVAGRAEQVLGPGERAPLAGVRDQPGAEQRRRPVASSGAWSRSRAACRPTPPAPGRRPATRAAVTRRPISALDERCARRARAARCCCAPVRSAGQVAGQLDGRGRRCQARACRSPAARRPDGQRDPPALADRPEPVGVRARTTSSRKTSLKLVAAGHLPDRPDRRRPARPSAPGTR